MRLLPNRKYKSGSGWAFWRWTDVPTGYIIRLHILKTALKSGLGALCVHWINASDPDPKHDHPVSFVSFILKGWYDELREQTDGEWIVVRRKWLNIIRCTDKHRIIAVSPGGCITFCIMGPKKQDWSFYVDQPLGAPHKVSWQEFNAKKKAESNEHA
jgi:hypothetical protein